MHNIYTYTYRTSKLKRPRLSQFIKRSSFNNYTESRSCFACWLFEQNVCGAAFSFFAQISRTKAKTRLHFHTSMQVLCAQALNDDEKPLFIVSTKKTQAVGLLANRLSIRLNKRNQFFVLRFRKEEQNLDSAEIQIALFGNLQ